MPARIVSTPTFTGPPAWARAGGPSSRTVASAAPVDASLRKLRRVVLIALSFRVRASSSAALYHTQRGRDSANPAASSSPSGVFARPSRAAKFPKPPTV